jgi:hypothetical protein
MAFRTLGAARDEEVLSPDEAAAWLKVPRKTFTALCRRGVVPGARKV